MHREQVAAAIRSLASNMTVRVRCHTDKKFSQATCKTMTEGKKLPCSVQKIL